MKKNLGFGFLFLLSGLPVFAGQQGLADLVVTSVASQVTGMSCGTNFAACSMELCVGLPSQGIVNIQNQSSSTAYNIAATIPSSFGGDLTQSSSGCATVAPGATCTITFKTSPTSTFHDFTVIPIQGSNTTMVSVEISVEGPNC